VSRSLRNHLLSGHRHDSSAEKTRKAYYYYGGAAARRTAAVPGFIRDDLRVDAKKCAAQMGKLQLF